MDGPAFGQTLAEAVPDRLYREEELTMLDCSGEN